MKRIGTRGSRLALWQANNLKDQLNKIGIASELVIIKTTGDKVQDLGFDKMEGKGFFTKEIEEALLSGKVDMAVHSLKDLPTEGVPGLVLGGLSKREDPSDSMIIRKDRTDYGRRIKVLEGGIVGTSSIRRKVQMAQFSPDLQLSDIRGNVPTRLNKLRNGQYDAVVLATAGVNRLGLDLSEFEVLRFNPIEFIPAPGQGVIAYQARSEDNEVRRILNKIHVKETALQSNVERNVLKLMQGGCQLPLGVYCCLDSHVNFHCYAMYSAGLSKPVKKAHLSQSTSAGLADRIVAKLLH